MAKTLTLAGIQSEKRLIADAKNRALRTFLAAIGVDVGMAVALFVYDTLNDASGWGSFDWYVLSFLFVKTLLVSAASYILRRRIDGSAVPTPLPPAPQPAPAERVGREGQPIEADEVD